MSFLESFFSFSNEEEFKRILLRKLQILSQYNLLIDKTMQIEYDFLQENQIYDYVIDEIYPQFTEIYNPTNYNSNIFNELSQYVTSKIIMLSDEESAIEINQMKDLFILLTSFVKYPSFIRNPIENLPLSNMIYEIRGILYGKLNDKQLYSDFLPFCAAQSIFDIFSLWHKCSSIFNNFVTNESAYILKEDDSKVILSSLEPKICCLDPQFNEFIEINRVYLVTNYSLAQKLTQDFDKVYEAFLNFKEGFHLIEQLYESHKNLLIQILPFDSVLKILDEEGYSLFNEQPQIKINPMILTETSDFPFYFKKIQEIENRIDFLKKDYDERCQFELYIREKYQSENEDFQLHEINYQNFKQIIDFFNKIIEDIDIFDDCIPKIQFFSSLFSDVEQYNSAIAKYLAKKSNDKKIECLHSIIEEKDQEIKKIQTETEENLHVIHLLKQNLEIFDDYKEHIVNCDLCKFNRSYVLTNCGHSFCDSCYQYLCNLNSENLKCPFCETPFTFDSIVKICWLSNKVSDDEEEEEESN